MYLKFYRQTFSCPKIINSLKLINEITITRAPILLGEGIPLFGRTFKDIKLEEAKAVAFHNDFIQVKYKVNYI